MEPRKLYRVREGRVVCGVCLGVAEYLNIDVAIVRIPLWLGGLLGLPGLRHPAAG